MESEPVGFLFFLTVLNWVAIKIRSFYLNCTSFLKKPSPLHGEGKKSSLVQNRGGGIRLSREEVELVMERLGLLCSEEEEELAEDMGSDEISDLFEDEDPSLGELREAFCVFDENCNGFIGARELQRVLSKLGFNEGLSLEECAGMIRAHVENSDGLIDFNDFVKFMESSF